MVSRFLLRIVDRSIEIRCRTGSVLAAKRIEKRRRN